MAQRPPLTVAEREAIYYGKLGGRRLCYLAVARRPRPWIRWVTPLTAEAHQDRSFDPLVAERALYWKRRHPKRGPTRILVDLGKDRVLEGLVLPKRTAMADFFRQACRELLQRRQRRPAAPPTAGHVHELWQVDGKEAVRLADGTIATVFEVREPVACVCWGAIVHAVQTAKAWRRLSLCEVQTDLRQVFTEFGLPVSIQTDRKKVYSRPPTEAFPTLFTLWLVGLGLDPHFTRPGHRSGPC